MKLRQIWTLYSNSKLWSNLVWLKNKNLLEILKEKKTNKQHQKINFFFEILMKINFFNFQCVFDRRFGSFRAIPCRNRNSRVGQGTQYIAYVYENNFILWPCFDVSVSTRKTFIAFAFGFALCTIDGIVCIMFVSLATLYSFVSV